MSLHDILKNVAKYSTLLINKTRMTGIQQSIYVLWKTYGMENVRSRLCIYYVNSDWLFHFVPLKRPKQNMQTVVTFALREACRTLMKKGSENDAIPFTGVWDPSRLLSLIPLLLRTRANVLAVFTLCAVCRGVCRCCRLCIIKSRVKQFDSRLSSGTFSTRAVTEGTCIWWFNVWFSSTMD